MNDRLRFRVWDKNNKVYFGGDYGVSYYLTDSEIDGDLYCRLCDGPFDLSEDDDFIVEQCTGLKDKKGNFIYENDLIKSPNNSYLLQVVWENGAWQTIEYTKDGKHEQLLYCLVNCYGVDLVSNIHEKESK